MCDLAAALSAASHGVPGWLCHNGRPSSIICNGSIPGWAGVNCSSQGTIINITIRRRGLKGTIPSSIGNLLGLTTFVLSFNSLTGTIPSQIGQLTMLSVLGLAYNQLSGTIPTSIFGMTQLYQLTLTQNNLVGTLSSSIGALKRLLIFSVLGNFLTGTIPSTIGLLVGMRTLSMQSNLFEGSIPPEIGKLVRVSNMALGFNLFTGELPSTFGYLTNLAGFGANNNHLVGTIPSSFARLTKLTILELNDNYLTGTIPTFMGSLVNMLFLRLGGNRLAGSIPEAISLLTALQSLDLANNRLTGRIPVISAWTSLAYFFLNDNNFVGKLSDVSFNSSALTFMDVSNNRFTGPLPEKPFLSEVLTVFGAAGNCLAPALPPIICRARALSVLALDGMGANCKAAVVRSDRPSKPMFSNKGEAALPPCLFGMPQLQFVHLAGNALTGTIPDVIHRGKLLKDVTLSHNELRGTIPHWLQRTPLERLDLSYNRFSGTLASDIAALSNSTYFLALNRLSGQSPKALRRLPHVKALTGNSFECNFDPHVLPQYDPDLGIYQCGSDSFQLSIYVWLSTVGLMLALCLACYLAGFGGVGPVVDILSTSDVTAAFDYVVHRVRQMCAGATVYAVLILLPTYCVLGRYFSTHQNRYAWTASVVYLSGAAPAIILMLLWALFTFLLSLCSCRRRGPEKQRPLQYGRKRYNDILHWVFVLVNVIVVVSLNGLYVFSTFNLSTAERGLVQLLLGIFKALWGEVFVKQIGFFRDSLLGSQQLGREAEGDMFTVSLLLTFNNVVIPCLAECVVDPNCFFNALFPADTVQMSYDYGQICQTVVFGVCNYIDINLRTKFSPRFTYNYQCSFSVITNYISVFIYMFITSSLITPLQMTFFWCFPNCFPRCVRRLVSHELLLEVPEFNWSNYIAGLFSSLAILFTFGTVYPPLAIVIFISILIDTCSTQYMMSLRLPGRGADDRINENSLFLLYYFIPLVALFYALILVDVLGNEYGFVSSMWAPIVMFVFPLIMLLLLRLTRREDDNKVLPLEPIGLIIRI